VIPGLPHHVTQRRVASPSEKQPAGYLFCRQGPARVSVRRPHATNLFLSRWKTTEPSPPPNALGRPDKKNNMQHEKGKKGGCRLFCRLLFCLTSAVLIATSLTGCVTNQYIESGYRTSKPPTSKPVVYVENPELKKELGILKQSRLFLISSDPSVKNHLILNEIKINGGCGMPMLSAVFTLGILPGFVYPFWPHEFTYTIRNNTEEQAHRVLLPHTYRRTSLWECFFKPFRNDNRLLGKVLRTEVLKRQPEQVTETLSP